MVHYFDEADDLFYCDAMLYFILQAFREYYPVKNEVVILECEWKEDKFVLLEKFQDRNNSKEEDGDAIPCESTIQYSTILLFDEGLYPSII